MLIHLKNTTKDTVNLDHIVHMRRDGNILYMILSSKSNGDNHQLTFKYDHINEAKMDEDRILYNGGIA